MSYSKKKTYFIFPLLFLTLFTILSTAEETSKETSDEEIKRDTLLFEKMLASIPDLDPIDRNKTHILRVLYVEDPSLPRLSRSQKTQLLKETEKLTLKLLGYHIRFIEVGREDIKPFFKSMEEVFKKPEFRYPLVDWPIPLEDKKRIYSTVEMQIKKHDETTLERYFGKPDEGKSMIQHVFEIFTNRLTAIYKEKDLAGKPLFNPERQRWLRFPYWSVIAYHLKKADFIITNVVAAGADTDMPIYVINRGGVTSAFVENNFYNKYRGVGIFFTYQYLSQGKFFSKYRGYIPPRLLIPIMAHLFVHELGHLLMHVEEYYDLPGSIHMTATDLRYLKWYRSINPSLHPADISKLRLLKKF